MRWSRILLYLALLAAPRARADLSTASSAPVYSAAGIVQAATQTVEALAPNTLASIYGTNLSFTTHALAAADLVKGTVPTTLGGVTVYVNGIQSSLFYVSPAQVNFLVPYEITTVTGTVQVVRDGVAGPAVTIQLANTAPGFFEWNGNFAVAEHADGSLISDTSPAAGGEIVVLYAAGLGRTVPDVPSGHVVSTATSILYASQMQVLVNGVPCPPSSIYYAGLTPGYSGLYQINLKLPDTLPADPAVQVVIGTQSSPASIRLFAQ